MINHLRIRNFKSWRDSGDIRLAPLTVLFGANSAGKTSIPHLLLMLRQTIESTDRKRVLHFGDPSTLVDLGGFREILYRHEVERALGVEIGWRAADPITIEDPLSDYAMTAPDLRFEVEIDGNEREQPAVRELSYRVRAGDRELRAGMRRRPIDSRYDLLIDGYPALRQPGRDQPLPPPVQFNGFPDEAIGHYQNTAFLADLTLRLRALLRSIHHVGPLRQYPDRTYLWSGEEHQHVGQQGERTVEAILAARDRRFSLRAQQRPRSLEEIVAERLKSMGLIHAFEVRPVARGRKEHEVLLQTHPGMPEVKLTDVGFGVSQVLPVIVECFATPPNSIMIIEQPEIHLHPRVQSDLADVFVDAIHAREGGHARNAQFIIESHSEHFLRRLQRRIAEEALHPDDAALYFVESDGAEARIGELELDSFGGIANWPEGFFGDEMADLVARAEARARRTQGDAR